MTLKDAYRIHRNASRNCGRGRGYQARGLDEALKVLEAFWAENGSWYVTKEMVEEWDRTHQDAT